MFGWRRKTDGFEWREYVRTTIKLRREDRARKIEEIKQAAAEGAKAAGRKGISAGQSGASRAWNGLMRGLHWLATAAGAGIRRCGSNASAAAKGAARKMSSFRFSQLGQSIAAVPTRAKIAAMFGLLGLLAAASGYMQFQQSGADWSTGLATVVAIALLSIAISPWFDKIRQTIPHWFRSIPNLSQRLSTRSVGAIAAVLFTAGAGFWVWQSGAISAASSIITSNLPTLPSIRLSNSLPDISGNGRAISGDTIRIQNHNIRLTGIEAPEISQVCRDKRNRAWSCGRRARSVLRQLIRRKKIACKNVSQTSENSVQATCYIGQQDIASELVAKGYAFSVSTAVKDYAATETQARELKHGVWQGKSQRPEEFRTMRWKRASESAPNGCPIKGRVVRKSKIYVLPWALDYRQVRVRENRGGRWFCSEEEATNAGFKPSSTG